MVILHYLLNVQKPLSLTEKLSGRNSDIELFSLRHLKTFCFKIFVIGVSWVKKLVRNKVCEAHTVNFSLSVDEPKAFFMT